MKVCFVGTENLPIPPPRGGGAEKFAYALACTMKNKGHEIHIVSLPLQSTTGVPTTVVTSMVNEKRWTSRHWLTSSPIGRFVWIHFKSYSFTFGVAKVLSRLCSEKQFDIVHSQTPPTGLSVLLVHNRGRARFVHSMHGFHSIYPADTSYLPTIFRHLKQYDQMIDGHVESYVLEKSNVITTVSESLKKHVVRRRPGLADKIHVVPAMVDAHFFNPDVPDNAILERFQIRGKSVILYVGRLVKIKGLKYLLLAMPDIITEFPDAVLVVAGPSAFSDFIVSEHGASLYVEELRSIIRRNNLESKIVFTGYVSNEDLRLLYNACSIVVVPSIWEEPCSASILEGMSSGKPVVATKIGGNVELLQEGKAGILVPPKDPHALAEGILYLLSEPRLMAFYGKYGRQRAVDLYSWEAIADRMLSVYEQVVT